MATNWPNSVQTFTNPTTGSALNSPSHADQHTTVNDTVEALQNYAGLVFVKSVSIGSSVTSVTVTDAFDSRFSNYRIHVEGTQFGSTTDRFLRIQFGGSTTGYYGALSWLQYTGSTSAVLANNDSMLPVGSYSGTSYSANYIIDVFSPYLAQRTTVSATGSGSGVANFAGGQHIYANSYSYFTLIPRYTSMTGGTIRVYGYNDGA